MVDLKNTGAATTAVASSSRHMFMYMYIFIAVRVDVAYNSWRSADVRDSTGREPGGGLATGGGGTMRRATASIKLRDRCSSRRRAEGPSSKPPRFRRHDYDPNPTAEPAAHGRVVPKEDCSLPKSADAAGKMEPEAFCTDRTTRRLEEVSWNHIMCRCLWPTRPG